MTTETYSLKQFRVAFLCMLGLVFISDDLRAQIDTDKATHHSNHYHLSAFAGFTTDSKGKNGYKLGLEYEYRLNEHIGLGGTFDFTGADFNIFALSVGADFYPFKFPLIPGILIGAKNASSKWKPFVRGILLYDFQFEKYSIGPLIMYDIYGDQNDIISFGVSAGFSLH